MWADLNPVRGREQAGLRPVLVLSHDVFNERSGTVVAMALTSQPQRAGFPLTLELTKSKLPKPVWVKISQIRTLSVARLRTRFGRAMPEELDQIVEGLVEIMMAGDESRPSRAEALPYAMPYDEDGRGVDPRYQSAVRRRPSSSVT